MVRIYLRHGEKGYKNGENSCHTHDPPLTEYGEIQSMKMAEQLIKKYGSPSVIICSPYRRCRDTANKMVDALPMEIAIHYDRHLSEYLGNHRNDQIDVTDETNEFQPPHPETFSDLERRVQDHDDEFSYLDDIADVVWFITHGLVITCLTRLFGKAITRIPPNGGIYISSKLARVKQVKYMILYPPKTKNNNSDSNSNNNSDNNSDNKTIGCLSSNSTDKI